MIFPKFGLKLNEKAALLIGFGVPSLIVLFYLFKRKPNELDDDEENVNSKTIRVRPVVLEVKIPNECVKHVIGPQGSVIKELQRKTNTRINFKDKQPRVVESRDQTTNVESTILVRGAPLNAQRAELEIKRLILDTPMCLTREYLIPEYACGRIIGRGGASIREIIQISCCKVTINKQQWTWNMQDANIDLLSTGEENVGDVKLATLVGTVEQIEVAKELILIKIKEEDELRIRKNPNRQSKAENTIDKVNRRPIPSILLVDIQNSGPRPHKETSFMSKSSSSPLQKKTQIDAVNLKSYLDEHNKIDVTCSAFSYSLVFWVQISANIDSLKQLNKKMSDFYESDSSNNFDLMSKDDLKEGDLVAIKSQHQWHRAEIKSTNVVLNYVEQPQLIDLYYVDAGVSDYVQLDGDKKKIKRLADEFYEMPMQAIECALYDVDPCNGGEWSSEAVEYFEKFIFKANTSHQIEYISPSSSSETSRILVELFDKTNAVSVSELLVKNGYAMWKTDHSVSQRFENVNNENSWNDETKRHENQ